MPRPSEKATHHPAGLVRTYGCVNRPLFLLLALSIIGAATAAEDPLVLACPACHGTADAPSTMPGPYGLPAARLRAMLQGYRDGSRAGTAMPRLAAALTDAQIDRLVDAYADHEATPAPP